MSEGILELLFKASIISMLPGLFLLFVVMAIVVIKHF
jgi:hypothetical protein